MLQEESKIQPMFRATELFTVTDRDVTRAAGLPLPHNLIGIPSGCPGGNSRKNKSC
jgi:hypothetical protein